MSEVRLPEQIQPEHREREPKINYHFLYSSHETAADFKNLKAKLDGLSKQKAQDLNYLYYLYHKLYRINCFLRRKNLFKVLETDTVKCGNRNSPSIKIFPLFHFLVLQKFT